MILCSHIGRPKFGYEEKYSLKPVWLRLEELLNRNIFFMSEAVGSRAQLVASRLRPGEIMLLENVRFVLGETKNDMDVAKQFASLARLVYVQTTPFGSVPPRPMRPPRGWHASCRPSPACWSKRSWRSWAA